MTQILIPIIVLSSMGILFGAGLAIASRVFAVKVDERVAAIRECLPGANCGACGYPGCDGFASSVVEGKAPLDGCPVGGPPVTAQIGAIMGQTVDEGVQMVATIICQGSDDRCKTKYEYDGLMDCRAAFLASGGERACRYACLGLGTCKRVCPFDAIILDNGIAKIDPEKCRACKMCLAVCPKNVIRMEPYHRPSIIRCRAIEKGKDVRDQCTAGCIGCQKCFKACKFDAIEMRDNLPIIDYDKCVGCMVCADACPTGSMWADYPERKLAVIDPDKCIGCTLCKRECRFDAIEGELRGPHTVIADKCTGCGLCEKRCPRDAIAMAERT